MKKNSKVINAAVIACLGSLISLPMVSFAELDDKKRAIEVVTVIGAVKPKSNEVSKSKKQEDPKAETLQLLPKLVVKK